jgi:hypothetical protein
MQRAAFDLMNLGLPFRAERGPGAGWSAAWLALLLATPMPAAHGPASSRDEIFQSTNLLRIAIEIPPDGIELLRRSRSATWDQEKPQAQATIKEGGTIYSNVTVQLKGFTTFQSIDRLPGLTLNFHKLAPHQSFHGLTKLSLNNSLQDGSRLNEKVARELFAAAGVPVPRADHALVTLNSRELGLYVLTEGFDRGFLGRHFERSDGCLFEGGVLQDVDRPLRLLSGREADGRAAVQKLMRAVQEPDPAKRYRALSELVDLERFFSMTAMETILCHSDSYSMNRNNYRLYLEPGSGRLVFMPHGMDRVLGMHRSNLDLPIVPPALGTVARALFLTPEGRRRHVERVGQLFTNVFNTETLCRRVQAIDAKIHSEKLDRNEGRGFRRGSSLSYERDAEDLCQRLTTRGKELAAQLAHMNDFLLPPAIPEFDTTGSARITGWKPRCRPGDAPIECAGADGSDSRLHLRLLAPPENGSVSLALAMGCRLVLPAGRYRLVGDIRMETESGSVVASTAAMLRCSSGRFDMERVRLQGGSAVVHITVSDNYAPEEIELLCEARGSETNLVFDASSLRVLLR